MAVYNMVPEDLAAYLSGNKTKLTVKQDGDITDDNGEILKIDFEPFEYNMHTDVFISKSVDLLVSVSLTPVTESFLTYIPVNNEFGFRERTLPAKQLHFDMNIKFEDISDGKLESGKTFQRYEKKLVNKARREITKWMSTSVLDYGDHKITSLKPIVTAEDVR